MAPASKCWGNSDLITGNSLNVIFWFNSTWPICIWYDWLSISQLFILQVWAHVWVHGLENLPFQIPQSMGKLSWQGEEARQNEQGFCTARVFLYHSFLISGPSLWRVFSSSLILDISLSARLSYLSSLSSPLLFSLIFFPITWAVYGHPDENFLGQL